MNNNNHMEIEREAIEKVEGSGDIHKRVVVTKSGSKKVEKITNVILHQPTPPGYI